MRLGPSRHESVQECVHHAAGRLGVDYRAIMIRRAGGNASAARHEGCRLAAQCQMIVAGRLVASGTAAWGDTRSLRRGEARLVPFGAASSLEICCTLTGDR